MICDGCGEDKPCRMRRDCVDVYCDDCLAPPNSQQSRGLSLFDMTRDEILHMEACVYRVFQRMQSNDSLQSPNREGAQKDEEIKSLQADCEKKNQEIEELRNRVQQEMRWRREAEDKNRRNNGI